MGTNEVLSQTGGNVTLANISAVDAATISTLTSSGLGGDITGVTAGDGLSGGGTTGAVTLNLDSELSAVTLITGEELRLGRDEHNLIDFQTDDTIKFLVEGNEQFYIENGIIKPRTTNSLDLGSASYEFKDAFFDGTVTSDAFAGPLTGNASTATALETSRNFQVDLASTSTAGFTGAANCTPGVTGTLAVGNGGTGLTSLSTLLNSNVTSVSGSSGTVTSIGNLTGDVTSSNRATTLAAAQPNIESIGTDGDTLTILSDIVTLSNSTASMPYVVLRNTTDASVSAPWFAFIHDRKNVSDDTQVGEDGDYCGLLRFSSYNDAGTPEATDYGYIRSQILDASDGTEKGRLELFVGNTGGATFNGCVPAIVMDGGDSGEADVTVGYGAASATTVAGTLDVTGGITGGYRMHYQIQGNSTGNGSTFEIPVNIATNKGPFQHTVANGSTGLDALSVQEQVWTGGHVMPRNGTLKLWKGWATCSGTGGGAGTCDIMIMKITPANASDSDVVPIKLDTIQFTSDGNDTSFVISEDTFTQASVSAGDIILAAIKT